MWPMLLGLEPILGNGICGYFKDTDDNFNAWKLSDGKVQIGANLVMELDRPFSLRNINKKVAVLIGHSTASSGEATAISFIGMQRTKLFGKDSAGQTTANAAFTMSDGAMMLLSTTTFVDRNRKIYGGTITPDFISSNPKSDAAEWIKSEE